MIILIGGEKGGTGKTTIAANLAVVLAQTGANIALVDADKQESSYAWALRRQLVELSPDVPCVQMEGVSVRDELRALAHRFDTIVVDAGGRDSVELRASMLVADLLFVPIQPSQLDLWTLEPMSGLVREARKINKKLKSEIIINRASTHSSSSDTGEAIEAIKDFKALPFSGLVLHDRASYRRSMLEGKSVFEFKPSDPKAKKELDAIYKRVLIYEKPLQKNERKTG